MGPSSLPGQSAIGSASSAPALDQHLGFVERREDLAIEELVPELGVEALAVTIRPATAWLDEQRRDGRFPLSLSFSVRHVFPDSRETPEAPLTTSGHGLWACTRVSTTTFYLR